jgi:hypothetical protein
LAEEEEQGLRLLPADLAAAQVRIHRRQPLEGGDGAQAIVDYGTAEALMVEMGDMLSAGLIAQFPNKFTK